MLFVDTTVTTELYFLQILSGCPRQPLVQVMPDDHSKSVPPLPIPNRTVKRLCADDSAATSVKVGHRQASYKRKTPAKMWGIFFVRVFDQIAIVPATQVTALPPT